jgi:hypothetical protein
MQGNMPLENSNKFSIMNFKPILFYLIIIIYLFAFLTCNNIERIERPFDIEVIQLVPDQVKPELYWESLNDTLFCYKAKMDYFIDGYELYLKIAVAAEISEELSVVMSYFNHIITPSVSFYSIHSEEVVFVCNNEYLQYSDICEIPSHKILKEGIYYMILRFKFKDCVMDDGYLGIRFPINLDLSLSSSVKYKYLESWERYPVFFSVENGQISEKPIHYEPHVWPEAVFNYLETITQ